jgi:hypothetical protein
MSSPQIVWDEPPKQQPAQGGIKWDNPPTAQDTGVLASLKRTGAGLLSLPGQIYHAVADAPKNPDEEKSQTLQGPIGLAMKRLVTDPMAAEHQKAQELRAQAATQTDEQANNAYNGTNHLANMHDMASVVPVLGPLAAGMVNRYTGGGGVTQDKSGAVTDLATMVAVPEIAKRAVPIVGTGLKRAAGGINNAVIDASGRASQYGANPGLGMAAEGVTGFRPGTIAENLRAPIARRGQQLTDLYSSPVLKGTTVDLSGAINDPFNSAIAEGTHPVTGMAPRPLIRRLGNAQTELTTQNVENAPQAGAMGPVAPPGTLPKPLNALMPEEALQVKRNIADRTKYNQAEYSEGVNDTLRNVGGNIKTVLNQAVPEGAPLNSRLHDLFAADEVLNPQAMNYKAGHIVRNATGNAVRGVGTNIASAMYKVGNVLNPETLPTAATMQPRPATMFFNQNNPFNPGGGNAQGGGVAANPPGGGNPPQSPQTPPANPAPVARPSGGTRTPNVPQTQSTPQIAYRMRSVGDTGIRPTGRPQAGVNPEQIQSFREGRGAVENQNQEMVKVDLSKLDPSEYEVHPNGFVTFKSAIPESFIERMK